MLAAAPAAALATPGDDVFGVWRNGKESVHLKIEPCGELACGVVIWATPEAEAKVRNISGKTLLGLQLFHEMKRAEDGIWRGGVFVPDINMTFTGSARTADGVTLRAKGCLLRSVFCRTQVWTRLN